MKEETIKLRETRLVVCGLHLFVVGRGGGCTVRGRDCKCLQEMAIFLPVIFIGFFFFFVFFTFFVIIDCCCRVRPGDLFIALLPRFCYVCVCVCVWVCVVDPFDTVPASLNFFLFLNFFSFFLKNVLIRLNASLIVDSCHSIWILLWKIWNVSWIHIIRSISWSPCLCMYLPDKDEKTIEIQSVWWLVHFQYWQCCIELNRTYLIVSNEFIDG